MTEHTASVSNYDMVENHILYGKDDGDTIYGSKDNVDLDSGSGKDILEGGKDHDMVYCELTSEHQCNGNDVRTVKLQSSDFPKVQRDYGKDVDYKSIYLKFKGDKIIKGISLGSCFVGYPSGFKHHIHYPALGRKILHTGYGRVYNQMNMFGSFGNWRSTSIKSLKNKVLWYVMDIYYYKKHRLIFTDKKNLYEVEKKVVKHVTRRSKPFFVLPESSKSKIRRPKISKRYWSQYLLKPVPFLKKPLQLSLKCTYTARYVIIL